MTDTPGPGRRRSIVANTAMNGVAQFAQVFSTLVFFPLLVRAFGAEQYGVYVIALTVTGMAQMFDFGIGSATVRLVAHRLSLDDTRGFARVVSTSTALLFAVGVVLAAIIAGVGLAAGLVFRVTAAEAELLRNLLFIGAAMQVWYWPSSVAARVLNGLERYDLAARSSLLATLGNVAMIGVVLATGAGPATLMILGAMVMVSASLINMVTLWFVRPSDQLACLPSGPVAQEIVSNGLPVFMNSLAQFFNREQVDRLVIGMAIGPAAVVVYEVAAKLSMLIGQLAILPTSAMLPVVSRVVARTDREALVGLFLKGGRYITMAITPLVVTLAILAGPFIQVWFGGELGDSVRVAQLLILSQLFYPPLLMGDPILTGTGRLAAWVPKSFVIAALNLVLSLVLVRSLGPMGVALATLIASLVELPLYARFMLKETGVSFGMWLKTVWAGYIALPATIVVAALAANSLLGDSLAGIGLAGIAAVGFYWVCVWVFLFDRPERERFVGRLMRLTARS
jgi:O-antigen/teichoic acid export membrane protein